MSLVVTELAVELGGQPILVDVSMAALPGKVTGLIGPNGAGKSTLMRAILGLVPLVSGKVAFEGDDLLIMPRRLRARLGAFVEQASTTETRLTVRDVVMLGRIPFQTVWQSAPSPVDNQIALQSLADVDMLGFADRLFQTLSGGEQQRVHIARALAQQPRLLILDEPTNHLDVHAQLSALSLLRARAKSGMSVVMALHDLNLAAAYCDWLIVLHNGHQVASGTPEQVLQPALLREVYGVEATVLSHPGTGRPMIAFDLPAI